MEKFDLFRTRPQRTAHHVSIYHHTTDVQRLQSSILFFQVKKYNKRTGAASRPFIPHNFTALRRFFTHRCPYTRARSAPALRPGLNVRRSVRLFPSLDSIGLRSYHPSNSLHNIYQRSTDVSSHRTDTSCATSTPYSPGA